MIVKDIVKIAANCLGRENAIKYLESNVVEGDALKIVNVLTRCVNLVVNELACTYVPMINKEEVLFINNRVQCSSLSQNVVEILNVYDSYGDIVNFKTTNEYVESNIGNGFIEYKYVPLNYGLTDLVGYKETQVPARVLAYGVVAEFTLSESSFSESVIWHKKYMDAISEICQPKNVIIKRRCWM